VGGNNFYEYCSNDPVNSVDLDGNLPGKATHVMASNDWSKIQIKEPTSGWTSFIPIYASVHDMIYYTNQGSLGGAYFNMGIFLFEAYNIMTMGVAGFVKAEIVGAWGILRFGGKVLFAPAKFAWKLFTKPKVVWGAMVLKGAKAWSMAKKGWHVSRTVLNTGKHGIGKYLSNISELWSELPSLVGKADTGNGADVDIINSPMLDRIVETYKKQDWGVFKVGKTSSYMAKVDDALRGWDKVNGDLHQLVNGEFPVWDIIKIRWWARFAINHPELIDAKKLYEVENIGKAVKFWTYVKKWDKYDWIASELHHLFPKGGTDNAMRKVFENLGIDDIEKYLMLLPKSFHTHMHSAGPVGLKWEHKWLEVLEDLENPTKSDLFNILIDMMDDYGLIPTGTGRSILDEEDLVKFLKDWNENMVELARFNLHGGQTVVQKMKDLKLIPDVDIIQNHDDVMKYVWETKILNKLEVL